MAIDRRIGTKVSKSLRREDTPAIRIDPYPYIGVVKNNYDSIRSGRLQVFIPDFGGDENNPKNWRTVNYASPFMGYTNVPKDSGTTNSFQNAAHTYGMWMVPPDIGVEVIVIFVGGDPLRGFWIACVNSNLSHYMVPGLAASQNVQADTADAGFKAGQVRTAQYPVVEFNENDPKAVHTPDWASNPKPVHEVQAAILRKQGLDRDNVRGAITSSSQRESPSHVFGISTPGRPINDPADDPDFENKVKSGDLTADDYAVRARAGGHTLVMDDGSISRRDQLFRLRSAGGHQIMMHDSNNTLYIANADGTVWIEMTKDGRLDVFSSGSISLRSEGSLNLHADSNVNINAGGSFNVRAGGKAQINSESLNLLTDGAITVGAGGTIGFNTSGAFNVKSTGISLDANSSNVILNGRILENSTAGIDVKKPTPIKSNSLVDTSFDKATGLYKSVPGALNTIVTIAPAHEPYPRQGEARRFEASLTPETKVGTQPQEFTGANDVTKTLDGKAVNNPVPEKYIQLQLDAPPPQGSIGPLDKDDLTAYFAQMGYSESTFNYNTQLPGSQYLGKYQIGIIALKDAKLIKDNVTSASQLDIASNWIGGEGKPSSKAEFLSSPELQEKAMWTITNNNYRYLTANGGITSEMSKEKVAGMLSAAHLVGQGPAAAWRKGGKDEADANGTNASDYFNRGKWALTTYGPKIESLRNG